MLTGPKARLCGGALVRTPFDSAVELDDLLEETRGLCPEVWTSPGALQVSRTDAVSSADQDERESRSHGTPADRPADPVPRWLGDPRPGQRRSQRLLDSG